ncbi:Outer membrane protein OmpA [Catalinimonas alkaloidigena]|uniref:Outer membrane protein OmpA n=1 Tax=Catalinimonas alkaloidigena TaxID=1075417 RepID=A0A1G9KW95_9BACT|nr:DUF5723 family protein [Catalinimonas alkaloidigena]SDL53998.1 Outer membrane protein OmpA [Catalinimonas alkaloidigena]
MKRLYQWLWGAALLLGGPLYGQSYLGIANSNYAGTNGIYMNPANAADSRYLVHFNLGTAGVNLSNNYFQYNAPFSPWAILRDRVPEQYLNADGKVQFENTFLIEKINGRSKMMHLGADVRGPSLLIAWNQRNSIGLSTRLRTAFQVNNMTESLARTLRYQMDHEDLFGVKQENTQYMANVNAYTEYGVTFARVYMEEGPHFIKSGVTLKLLNGVYSAYMHNQGTDLTVYSADSLEIHQANLAMGYTSENQTIDGNSFFRSPSGRGFGADLGLVYEYRPDFEDHQFKLDGQPRTDGKVNKYTLRLSAALLDVGNISYSNRDHVRTYTAQTGMLSSAYMTDMEGEEFEDFEDVKTYVDSLLGITPGEKRFNAGLPTALNLQADVKVANRLYINATWMQSLRGRNFVGMRENTYVAVTPRVEFRWLEIAFPMSLTNNFFNFNFGPMVRLGPVFAGSDNLAGLMGKSRSHGMDFYMGASIPIGRVNLRKKDRDNDGVSNRKDQCPEAAGSWETGGCPDTDGDGVLNRDDRCPNLAGPANLGGCPDSDGDGVIDSKDRCKDIPGSAELFGCPDTDGDGINDHDDLCPDVAGSATANGCPDSDGDGVADKDDKCPTLAGPEKYQGCPDTDGDKVPDPDDKCPELPGIAKWNGCPDTDFDGLPDDIDACPTVRGSAKMNGCPDKDFDGVVDHEDECPSQFGSPENNGCPLVKVAETDQLADLTQDEEETLRAAFEHLEFESGKAVIRADSKANLDDLAKILIKKSAYRLRIDGHTDNVGSDAANLKLSRDRAEAVKLYLVQKRVSATHILTEGYGETRPAASNDTEAGRQRNRRVELKVIK